MSNNLRIVVDRSLSDTDRLILESLGDLNICFIEGPDEIKSIKKDVNSILFISGSDGQFEGIRRILESTPGIPYRFILVSGYEQYKKLSRNELQNWDDILITPLNEAVCHKAISNNMDLLNFRSRLREDASIISSLNTERNELLSIAAHDLKNPIYSMSMLAKVIKSEKELSREEIEEFSGDIITTSQRMLALISNLLDISKIEQGKLSLKFEEIDVIEIIRAVLEIYRERANAKGITLELDNEHQRLIIKFDRNAIFQILDNLISNAIKFSPFNKKVTVTLVQSDSSVNLMVKDQGPGISKEEMPFLFTKFSKLSAMPSGDEDSTGLGLSIVKKYADLTNSKVSCFSEPGAGSIFILEIPSSPNG